MRRLVEVIVGAGPCCDWGWRVNAAVMLASKTKDRADVEWKDTIVSWF
jgi:hypothetical protein